MDVRVGICEDDQHLRSVLARALQAEDFEVRVTGSGRDAVRVFSEHAPDLLVLDIGLPDADGRDVCQALRAHGVDAPVLFLTARGNLTDKLSAFQRGRRRLPDQAVRARRADRARARAAQAP